MAAFAKRKRTFFFIFFRPKLKAPTLKYEKDFDSFITMGDPGRTYIQCIDTYKVSVHMRGVGSQNYYHTYHHTHDVAFILMVRSIFDTRSVDTRVSHRESFSIYQSGWLARIIICHLKGQ